MSQKCKGRKFTNSSFIGIIVLRMNKKTFFMMMAVLIAGVLGFAMPLGAQSSQNPVIIDLEKTGLMYFNADPSLAREDMDSPEIRERFSPIAGRTMWVGQRAPVAWVRFSLPASTSIDSAEAPGQQSESTALSSGWLLRVRPSFSIILDSVELYVPQKSGGYKLYVTGALHPESSIELDSRYFLFSLPPDAGSGEYYLRFSSNTDVLIHLELMNPKAVSAKEVPTFVVYGIIFGMLIAMAMYSIFMFILLKDRSYLYYIFFTLSIGAWLFFVQGFSKALLGKAPYFDQAMLWLWAGMFITWGTIFSIFFLKMRHHGILFVLMIIAALLGACVSAAGLLGWNRIAFWTSHYLGLVVPILIIVAAGIRLSQGFKPAFYFLIAWVFLSIGGLVFSLMGLQVLPVNFLTVNALSIGVALESILLGMALADRFRQLEMERAELEKAQKRYRELSYTDILTGFYNKLFLNNYFENSPAANVQNGKSLSGILIDVDNLKNINDTYGHPTGDGMLSALASSIRTCTRGKDIVCRWNSDEFVILLPETSKENAYHVAERIRMRYETDSLSLIRDKAIHCTVSLGVIQFQEGEDKDSFLVRLDTAMYEAKHRGKNCTVMM